MPLQLRLAVSYLLVIALFLTVFAVSWLSFTARPTALVLREQARDYGLRLRDAAAEGWARGGLPAARQAMEAAILPPRARLTVYPPQGSPVTVQGALVPEDAEALAGARAGRPGLRLPRFPDRTLTAWIPFRAGRNGFGALALSLPSGLPSELRQHLAWSFLYSGLLASLAALVAGWPLSRFLARPLRRLADAASDLGAGDLSRRVPEEGPGEFRELARRFNGMADSLEGTMASLRQSEAARREFLADVSHNLRTPLAAILGWTEALQDGLAPGEEQDRLARIHREALFVSRAVKRLLELSRWDSAPPVLRRDPVPLSTPLMEAAEAVEAAFPGTPPELRMEGDIGAVVCGDPERLRELVQILLENAVEHARSCILVTARTEGGRLRVAVEDDGPGIPADELPVLFQGFRRREGGKGMGLGLALAAHLARAHGGSLEASRSDMSGARLAFTLPLHAPQVP